ncbi:MAG: FAD-dependent oxidoreductase, partial [Clostridia bacterium]|nr:FAD-dependent oxidoreductase [Clostridia bacterium]
MDNIYDIIVVGGGPAGLTAALYARRANKTVLIIEKGAFGGQITFSPKVENIPGFTELSGNEFADKLVEQVMYQGAEIEIGEVTEIQNGDIKTVVTDMGSYQSKAVIIAVGAKHRLLGLADDHKWVGNGVSFCAVCDGAFYRDKVVGVVGGGNSALQEALLLSDLASKVIVMQNLDYFTGEQKLVDQLYQKDNVEIILGAVVTEYVGDKDLTGVVIKTANGTQTVELDGLFVAIGLIPQNEPFENIIALNAWGYADSTETCTTKTDGIFVAGDCRSKRIRQVATAVADGAISALAA